ncbi:MAG: PqqD family protein [Clostridiales bacterium]|nr:PqqD family protein [Clostridiales bacterium]
MTRREFLKLSGAFVLICAAGWRALPELEKMLGGDSKGTIGPILQDGLDIKPNSSGASVFYDGQVMFTVNETGYKLLKLADGTKSVDSIVKNACLENSASDVGMFFVSLGKAGYLKNRVEIQLYENRI